MQITRPAFYKEFSCIAGACPDTCCAGWQIMIDDNSLKKYKNYKGPFRNRLHNDIDWEEHSFRQYDHRCAFLNDDNLCDMYSEAGKNKLCDTCRKYPRHIEEFEGLREYSLSLSCPEAARIFLSHKEKISFVTKEVPMPDETYDDFDYLLFTALMDTRDYLFDVIQDRSVPVRLRRQKLLACAHDFQLSLDKNELFQWEDIRERHKKAGFGEKFLEKIQRWAGDSLASIAKSDIGNHMLSEAESEAESDAENSFYGSSNLTHSMQIWKCIIPEMEVLRSGWHDYLRETLKPLYASYKNDMKLQDAGSYKTDAKLQDAGSYKTDAELQEAYNSFEAAYPDWAVQEEQLLLYWVYTYFCGAVYDDQIFAKIKMAVVCTFMIHELAVGTYLKNNRHFTFEDMVFICYHFSRELEHSDPNLNAFERLMDEDEIFAFKNLLKL